MPVQRCVEHTRVGVIFVGELRLSSPEHLAAWARRTECSQVYAATWPEFARLGVILAGVASRVVVLERGIQCSTRDIPLVGATSWAPNSKPRRSSDEHSMSQWRLLAAALRAFTAPLELHQMLIKARTDIVLPDQHAFLARFASGVSESSVVHTANDYLIYAPTSDFFRIFGDFWGACQATYYNRSSPCDHAPGRPLGSSCSFKSGPGHKHCWSATPSEIRVYPSWRWRKQHTAHTFASLAAMFYHIVWVHNATCQPALSTAVQLEPTRYNMTWGMNCRKSSGSLGYAHDRLPGILSHSDW